jgi:hypothetical protein
MAYPQRGPKGPAGVAVQGWWRAAPSCATPAALLARSSGSAVCAAPSNHAHGKSIKSACRDDTDK